MKLSISIFFSLNSKNIFILVIAFNCPAVFLHRLLTCVPNFDLLSISISSNLTELWGFIVLLFIPNFYESSIFLNLFTFNAWNCSGFIIIWLDLNHLIVISDFSERKEERKLRCLRMHRLCCRLQNYASLHFAWRETNH